jgi:hypothetical protein
MRLATTRAAGILIAATVLIQAAKAEEVKIESYPSNYWFRTEIKLHIPSAKPTGLLVLVAGDIRSFSAALLPKLLATNETMTLIVAPARAGLLASDAMLEELDSLIGDVLSKFGASNARVAIGGFSAGGIGAVRYAQFCLKGERKAHTPAAVFAVDSPLDYERWFLGAELYLQRLALAGRDIAEDRRATNELRTALGGRPAEAAETYSRYSPLTARLPDGGNARLLKSTPLRIYIEPELKWRVEQWNREVFHTNIPDATALINILRLLGNTEAELITTSGAGYMPDGSRNPHSWSIVDEPALARWLIQFLHPARTQR